MQVLLLTRNKETHSLISKVTTHVGLGCKATGEIEEAREVLRAHGADVLIIDADSVSGTEPLISWIHERLPASFPVIASISTSTGPLAALLQHGVTDYIVQPLRQHELALRLRLAMQRAYPDRYNAAPAVFGDYVFDETNHLLSIKSQPVELTHKEFALALLLFRHLNRPLSRAFIVEKIWSRELEVSSRTVDTHVSRIRSKLGLKPDNGFRLVPVYSFGYRLEQLHAPASP